MIARIMPEEDWVLEVEGEDETQEQWEVLRRRLSPPPQRQRVPVAEMYRAYEEATGTLVGCD